MTTLPGKIVIAGVCSGVGKTSLTLGLLRSLKRRGMVVQPFKVGPDFLDPTYLSLAAGRTCYNLDGWMTSREYVEALFARVCDGVDIAIVEGVMGLFDGASPDSLEGSSAEIAMWLDAPVLLVAGARGAARSLAATVHGFASFEEGLRVAGVIANHSGSDRHRQWLFRSLESANLPPLVGAVPRGALPTLQSRHLGLVSADASVLDENTINQLADACEKYLDVDAIVRLARESIRAASVSERTCGPANGALVGPLPYGRGSEVSVRLGIARDEAFHFYYPDNLEMLAAAGAELVEFSPLRDAHLPEHLDGLYVGGGYPEVHAKALAANASLRQEIRQFADAGGAVYAECGGLMYLGRSLRTKDGRELEMCGVLPIDTAMLPKLRTLGYAEATLTADSPLGPADTKLRGHEFHYSEIVGDDSVAEGWSPAYQVRRRYGGGASPEGFRKGNVLASYVHMHFGSCPAAAEAFVERLVSSRRGRWGGRGR